MKNIKIHRYLIVFILGLIVLVSGCGKSEEDYKKTSVSINYEEFIRKPDSFKGQAILFTSTINNVKENGKEVDLLISGQTPILAHYTLKGKEERLVANDTIRIWGDFKKVSSKKTIDMMPETSVIEIDAKYITKPVWTFLFGGIGYNNWTNEKDGNVNPLDSESMQLSLSGEKINIDNVEVRGIITLNHAYFHLNGFIDDNGIGEFEFVDKDGKEKGVKVKIKINNKNEIEIETAKMEQEVPIGFMPFGKEQKPATVIIKEGKYVLRCK